MIGNGGKNYARCDGVGWIECVCGCNKVSREREFYNKLE